MSRSLFFYTRVLPGGFLGSEGGPVLSLGQEVAWGVGFVTDGPAGGGGGRAGAQDMGPQGGGFLPGCRAPSPSWAPRGPGGRVVRGRAFQAAGAGHPSCGKVGAHRKWTPGGAGRPLAAGRGYTGPGLRCWEQEVGLLAAPCAGPGQGVRGLCSHRRELEVPRAPCLGNGQVNQAAAVRGARRNDHRDGGRIGLLTSCRWGRGTSWICLDLHLDPETGSTTSGGPRGLQGRRSRRRSLVSFYECASVMMLSVYPRGCATIPTT